MGADLNQAHLVLQERYLRLKGRFEADHPGHTLVLTCVYRSPAEQLALYAKGRQRLQDGTWALVNPGARVTNCDGVTKPSKHNVLPARAVDVVVVVGGKWLWAEVEYDPLGPISDTVGLVWGGSWKSFQDRPHLELPAEVV